MRASKWRGVGGGQLLHGPLSTVPRKIVVDGSFDGETETVSVHVRVD